MWYKYGLAAKQLGGAAWELAALPEPDRTYWLHRGLLWVSSENEAYQQDEAERTPPMAPGMGPGGI